MGWASTGPRRPSLPSGCPTFVLWPQDLPSVAQHPRHCLRGFGYPFASHTWCQITQASGETGLSPRGFAFHKAGLLPGAKPHSWQSRSMATSTLGSPPYKPFHRILDSSGKSPSNCCSIGLTPQTWPDLAIRLRHPCASTTWIWTKLQEIESQLPSKVRLNRTPCNKETSVCSEKQFQSFHCQNAKVSVQQWQNMARTKSPIININPAR
jgi:hypothetical protein